MKKVWERVERNVHDRISAWHQGAGGSMDLHKFLGWTEEEYAAWVQDPKKIPEREFSQ